VKTKNPEETEMALRGKLPRRYWIRYNDLLVSFGQNICVPSRRAARSTRSTPFADE
jgi:endonuclease-3